MHRYRRHRAGQAHVLDGLGYTAHHAGDPATAARHYSQAAVLYEELGDDYFLADALDMLGEVYGALQRHDQARVTWRRAIRLYAAQRRGSDVSRLRGKCASLSLPRHHDLWGTEGGMPL
ncbi:tol-pal system YbgF family protein [Saccharothrix saharensis]|uniref:tetratricopeptide repeat protein n=1 Tax=Saccharothrix saharensis TaxID=571190 RepID=UPI0036CBDB8B